MKKTALILLAALVLGTPLGGIAAMLLTPVLWRLEPVLHLELTGHSGPSDWLILVVIAITVSVLFLLLRRVFSSPKSSDGGDR